jgi:hypothetical protein
LGTADSRFWRRFVTVSSVSGLPCRGPHEEVASVTNGWEIRSRFTSTVI